MSTTKTVVGKEDEATLRESVIERYLVRKLKEALGTQNVLVKKIGGAGWRGWPDRVLLLRGAVTVFVELKRPKGGKFEPLQLRTHRNLRNLNFQVEVLNNRASVNDFVSRMVAQFRILR